MQQTLCENYFESDVSWRNHDANFPRRLTAVSSTLLHGSGFKRNLIKVALFYVCATGKEGFSLGPGWIVGDTAVLPLIGFSICPRRVNRVTTA